MAGRAKPLIIAVVILFTFMITIAYGIEITREEPLEREAIWLELIEPKFTPYYINVWDSDGGVTVAARTSEPISFSARDSEDTQLDEPELVRNYGIVKAQIHPLNTSGHYSFKIIPDYPENQFSTDISNPGTATFRASVPGSYRIVPEFYTSDGKLIVVSKGPEEPNQDEMFEANLTTFSIKVKDTCRRKVYQVDCESEETNQNCKNIFGVNEIVEFNIIMGDSLLQTFRGDWTHSNIDAGDFGYNDVYAVDPGSTSMAYPRVLAEAHEYINDAIPMFQASTTANIADTITVKFNKRAGHDGEPLIVARQKETYNFKISEPKYFIPVDYDPAIHPDYVQPCNSGERGTKYCSDLNAYGPEGDISTGQSMGINAGYYLKLEPSQACFRNILIRDNFTNCGNTLGPNNCIKWVWPNGETYCPALGTTEGDTSGTIPIGIWEMNFDNIYRDKAKTGLFPLQLMNEVAEIYKYPVRIKIEWKSTLSSAGSWKNIGRSGFCAYFHPNGQANARRVVDRIGDGDTLGYPENPCNNNIDALYYTESSLKGPWLRPSH